MTKGRSSYDRGMKQPSTRRILGRPIDAFESVVPGYLITIDGRIWSRLTTRGMRDEWEQHDRVSRPRRATASVALKAPGLKRPRELSVAHLMLKAAFGELPTYTYVVGWTVRYVNGDKGDCALANLRFGPAKQPPPPLPEWTAALPWADLLVGAEVPYPGRDGPKLAADEPELRRRGFDDFEVPL
jgi:hypothetical protein